MPSPIDRSNSSPLDADLDVCGAIPHELSGRLVALDPDGVIHSVLIGDGRASYRGRRPRTETPVHDLVDFGGSMLLFGDDACAYQLEPSGDTLHRVDLAGNRRPLAARPTHDAATGELHLVARDANGLQAYVVVSEGALTRRSRALPDTPERIHDLAISRDRAIFVTGGCVGVAPRNGELRTTWIAARVATARLVHAHDVGGSVIVLALTPLLERWTLRPEAGTFRREVLDPTPRRSICFGVDGPDGAPHCVWTTGDGTIGSHDLLDNRHHHHRLHPGVPDDFVFVVDATRRHHADGGWLVGFVHLPSGGATELRVIDAADIAGPAIASAPIPRFVAPGLRCTWIASSRH